VTRARAVLDEEHLGGLAGGAHRFDHALEQTLERLELRRRQLEQSMDKPHLGGHRSASHYPAAGRRESELAPPMVAGSRPAHDQALFDQPAHHDRDRALVGVRPIGQLVDGARRLLGQLLEHEQLSAADPESALAGAGRPAQILDDPAHSIQHLGYPRVHRRRTHAWKKRVGSMGRQVTPLIPGAVFKEVFPYGIDDFA
jgi:hypothetical protein